MIVNGLRRREEEHLARARLGEPLAPCETVQLIERLRRTRLAPVHAQALLADQAQRLADVMHARARCAEAEVAQLRVSELELRQRLQEAEAKLKDSLHGLSRAGGR